MLASIRCPGLLSLSIMCRNDSREAGFDLSLTTELMFGLGPPFCRQKFGHEALVSFSWTINLQIFAPVMQLQRFRSFDSI